MLLLARRRPIWARARETCALAVRVACFCFPWWLAPPGRATHQPVGRKPITASNRFRQYLAMASICSKRTLFISTTWKFVSWVGPSVSPPRPAGAAAAA